MATTSRKLLIKEIVDYISERYTNDEKIVELINKYNTLENRLSNRKRENAEREKKTFTITQDVRNYLCPLVDAEYFKILNYGLGINHLDITVKAMKQLDSRIFGYTMEQTVDGI